jgi:hypothetical protein
MPRFAATATPLSSRRFIILGTVALLVLVIAWRLNIAFERFSNVQREFESIHSGDSRESVKARFGRPNYYAGKCGKMGVAGKICALEWVYSDPLAPIDPHYYVISFPADDRVIRAQEWASP